MNDSTQLVTNKKNWPGRISATKMLSEGFVTLEQINEAASRIDSYFVGVDRAAETRCIDGRCNSRLPEDHLGAQVPGGTAGAALAYRLALIVDNFDVGVFTDDSAKLLNQLIINGFIPGDHRDTYARGTGCGAIDKMDLALGAMTDPSLVLDHERILRKLMNSSFDERLYMEIIGAAVILQSRTGEYFANREQSIEQIEGKINHRVSVLEGEHHECLVIINMVPGTTFATKRFSEDFHGMQAFNYDVWWTFEVANSLFSSKAERSRYITARLMTAVATLMVLTDGSQRLIVRSN